MRRVLSVCLLLVLGCGDDTTSVDAGADVRDSSADSVGELDGSGRLDDAGPNDAGDSGTETDAMSGPMGALRIKLLAQDSEGAVYRLRGTRFQIVGSINTTIEEDSLGRVHTLPVGSYTASLAEGWYVENGSDNSRQDASLVTTEWTFTIASGAQTPLPLDVRIGADTISFGASLATVAVCLRDHHVQAHACVPCETGVRAEGDDPAGADTTCETSHEIVSIHTSYFSVCVLDASGQVHCATGDPTAGRDLVTENAPDLGFSAMSLGSFVGCGVLRTDRSLACWGNDVMPGMLSPPDGAFVSTSLDEFQSCGLLNDGSISCWGEGTAPGASPSGTGFVAVDAGASCAIRNDATLECWGASMRPMRTNVSAVSGFASDRVCALGDDGFLECPQDAAYIPTSVTFTGVSVGEEFSCGVTEEDGRAFCWRGHNPLSSEFQPPDIEFAMVSVGGNFACGVTPTGLVNCWGITDLTPNPDDLY